MTIHDYLNYPMGKGASVMMIGEAKSKMIEKFLLDESSITYNLYNTGKTLVFHFEIPSHSTKGIMYDVIVEFPYTQADLNIGNSLYEFPFKVYSNCPSFVYSYAYVFYQKGLICDWLLSRYDRKTLTTPPKTRNEFGIIFYEKSIFFALYYIRKNMNQSLDLLTKSARRTSISDIKSRVNSQTNIRSNTKLLKEEGKMNKVVDRAMRSSDQEKDVMRELVGKTKKPIGARTASKPKGTRGAKGPTKPRSTR